jgi:dTDP-4-dehydrorhamnose reductase
MRVLITGASGLLGINLAMQASQQHTVFGTVNSHALSTDAFSVLQTDLSAPGAVERLLDDAQPDWVIHCAALADVEACESDPLRARQLNSELPEKLARHVARGGARMVHLSTDSVFDGQRGNYSEEDAPNPINVYARTKLEGEVAVASTNPQAIIARVNLYGWSLTGKRSLAEFFYNNLSAGRQVLGFTDVYFCPLLANELGNILLKMLEMRLSGLYNVVSRECISKYEFGVRLARKFGLPEELIQPESVVQGGLAAARSPNLTLRTDKITRALGEAPPGIDSALNSFYEQFLEGYPEKIRKFLLPGPRSQPAASTLSPDVTV